MITIHPIHFYHKGIKLWLEQTFDSWEYSILISLDRTIQLVFLDKSNEIAFYIKYGDVSEYSYFVKNPCSDIDV